VVNHDGSLGRLRSAGKRKATRLSWPSPKWSVVLCLRAIGVALLATRFSTSYVRIILNKELIVLDDGEDVIVDLVPNDERIRYVRLDHRLSLGAKCNLRCKLSRESLIAHWDGDDWMSAKRLSIQVVHLLESDALACGARHLLYYSPDAGETWIFHLPPDLEPS
jgi:Glycosyl transferase family 2